jgi:hypothetical protein
MKGDDVYKSLTPGLAGRDEQILSYVLNGDYVLDWHAIAIDYGGYRATFMVSNALQLGNAYDSFRVSVSQRTMQRMADYLGCAMLTKGMADQIYNQADVKLTPHPMGTAAMTSTKRMMDYHKVVENLRAGRTGLIANEGKDWITHSKLVSHPVAADGGVSAVNYGWYYPIGQYPRLSLSSLQGIGVIQGPGTFHNYTYADYSQLARFVWRPVFMCTTGVVHDLASGSVYDGKSCSLPDGEGYTTVIDIYDMMADPNYRAFINMGDTGLNFMRHPKVPWTPDTKKFVPPTDTSPPSGSPFSGGPVTPHYPPPTPPPVPQPPPPSTSGGPPQGTAKSESWVSKLVAATGAGVLGYLGAEYLLD